MYPPVTHTDRYVHRRDPDQAVKPPSLELPHRQDRDRMRRLAFGSANSQSRLCLAAEAKKAALLVLLLSSSFKGQRSRTACESQYLSLVCDGMCSVFWLFWLSCHYLPTDWLERLL